MERMPNIIDVLRGKFLIAKTNYWISGVFWNLWHLVSITTERHACLLTIVICLLGMTDPLTITFTPLGKCPSIYILFSKYAFFLSYFKSLLATSQFVRAFLVYSKQNEKYGKQSSLSWKKLQLVCTE